jgi:hypothetical protein
MKRFLVMGMFAACLCSGQSGMNDPRVRYVSKMGSDSNDGSSWDRAKLTVAAAVNALVYSGTPGSGGHHVGQINIGPGVFVETATPIEWNERLTIIGSGSTDDATNSGTVIKLGANRNTALFSYTSDFAQLAQPYSHYLQMRDVTLDGNSGQNTAGVSDLVRQIGGGFNNSYQNVSFINASHFGFYQERHAVNVALYSCTFSNDLGGAMYFHDTDGSNIVTVVDTQIDNSGPNAITIEQTDTDNGSANSFSFINLKTESTLPAGNHAHVINLKPRPSGGGFPVGISVLGGYGINTVGSAVSFAHEDAGNGPSGKWLLQNISGSYPRVLLSDKTGAYSAGSATGFLSSNDITPGYSYAHTPEFEGPAGTFISYGSGAPNGQVKANPGSIWIQTNGGAGSTFWVKESGMGTDSGWAAK